MKSKFCLGCGELFEPRSQTPTQSYCAKEACQRERRRLWQKRKRLLDPDYYENQTRAQQAWIERNPDYWTEYRRLHPNYDQNNRAKQRPRNNRRRKNVIAKMDASNPTISLVSGIYNLIPLDQPGIAKMDSWTVKLTLITLA